MSRRAHRTLVVAAQKGDPRAQDAVVRACLPLVYNVVGRALGANDEVEDVVQETMLRLVRGLPELRRPESLRAWALTIAVRQMDEHRSRAQPVELEERSADGDFEDLVILRLQLSGQRRQIAQAARWLDDDHRTVLALWWQEAAGQLDRAELADALETSVPYAAVRVQRMRVQLDRSRAIVSALESPCAELDEMAAGWDGEPSPLWRKRFDRHVRDCSLCAQTQTEAVPVEKLLAGVGLVAVPAALSGTILAASLHGSGTAATSSSSWSTAVFSPAGLATTAAAVTLVVGATFGFNALLADDPAPVTQQLAANQSAAPTTVPVTTATTAPQETKAPTPTRTKPSATRTTTQRAAKTAAAPTSSISACDNGSTAATWADWPMPNPAGSGLPNQARYRTSNSVVTDRVTCLEWQREAAPDVYTWNQAQSYCKNLKLDGGGWKLPTRIELTSIVDTTRNNPAINPDAFPGTTPRFFWTASPWAVTTDPPKSWIINFYEGLASNNADQNDEFNVRCVRSKSGEGQPEYEITKAGARDPGTGLTWQRERSPKLEPGQAEAYCEEMGWRLPSIQELATTVDESQVAPAVDRKAFPDTAPDDRYWSATVVDPKPESRWALNYDDGFITYQEQSSGYVRCVR